METLFIYIIDTDSLFRVRTNDMERIRARTWYDLFVQFRCGWILLNRRGTWSTSFVVETTFLFTGTTNP